MGRTPSFGLRGKIESPTFMGWSGEVSTGARVTFQTPPLIDALIKAF